MASKTVDLIETIKHLIYLVCDIVASVLWQLILLTIYIVSWCFKLCFHAVLGLLEGVASAVTICLRLIGTGSRRFSQMKPFSDGTLWPEVLACIIGVGIFSAALLLINRASKPKPPKSGHLHSGKHAATVSPIARSKTYTQSYTTPAGDSPVPFDDPLRPYKTWDGVQSSLTPPPPPYAPSYSPAQSSSSYFFRSFDAAEYSSFLKSLPDERLRKESETILSNLGANVGGAAVHWGHAALTGMLTAPLSVAGSVVSGRKGYVNKRKLELVENELNSRALSAKFGTRGFARLARNSLLTGAMMGMHPGS